GHVVVDQRLEFGRLVAREKGHSEKEDLRLPLAEVAHERHERADVALLLANDGRGRMLARAREPRAVARTPDLHEPLGPAADMTDLFAERRTSAAGAPRAAEGTKHSRQYCI